MVVGVESDEKRLRELGAKLRQAARDNQNSNSGRIYKGGALSGSLSDAQVSAGMDFLSSVIEEAIDRAEDTDFECVRRPFEEVVWNNERFFLVEQEKSVMEEQDGFDEPSEDDIIKVHHPVCLVSLETGNIYNANTDKKPDLGEGIRANLLDHDSLRNCINPRSGFLHLFGGTVSDYIFSLGVPVDTANAFGETALIQACQCAHVELCRWLLVDANANANHETKAGANALMFAAERASEQHEEIVRILVAEGNADVNHRNVFGVSALHVAAFKGHLAMCKLLLDLGADPSLTDGKGKTPADYTHKDSCYRSPDGTTAYNPDLEALLSSS